MFNEYPYRNLTDLNLDYILNAIKTFQNDVTNFVSINAIKYANPIQWDITRQYEKNTIVIDPVSGTAYISVAPVPSGIALTREEYWSVVFDLSMFIVRAAKNFTNRYEAETTITATFPTAAGEWVVWGDTLYRALSNIIAGDQYVIGSNIERITVEEIKNEIYQAFNNIIGDLADLDTTAKTNLVAAINEVVTALADTAGDLADLDTSDKSNLVAAINEVVTTLADIAGDLADLDTSDKSNLVAAINEVVTKKANKTDVINVINMKENGCIPDGMTDNISIINTILSDIEDNSVLYFPRGVYYISAPIDITKPLTILGDGGVSYDASTIFKCSGDGIYINASGCTLKDFKVLADSHSSVGVGIYNSWSYIKSVCVDDAPTSKYFDTSFDCGDVVHGFWNETIENCSVNTYHDDGLNHLSKMLGNGFKFIGAVNSLISNCWVNHKNKAVSCPPTITDSGYYVDGLTFDNLNVVWCNYGLYCEQSRSLYFSNTIIDQCNHGAYLHNSIIGHFSNLHIGQNNLNAGTELLQFDTCNKYVVDNADLHAQTAATSITIGNSNDIEINETFINNATYGIYINNSCGNVTGKNIYCNSVDYGVTAYSITFIENVVYSTISNYNALAFDDKHTETISGTIADLGTLNYFAPTITTQYNKVPDNIVFTITKNDSLTPIDYIYRKAGTGVGGPSVLLFKSDGSAFSNEEIEYECTCFYK